MEGRRNPQGIHRQEHSKGSKAGRDSSISIMATKRGKPTGKEGIQSLGGMGRDSTAEGKRGPDWQVVDHTRGRSKTERKLKGNPSMTPANAPKGSREDRQPSKATNKEPRGQRKEKKISDPRSVEPDQGDGTVVYAQLLT